MNKKKVCIIDYGLGNTVSAKQSFLKCCEFNSINAEIIITKDLTDISLASHIVLPGQGAFSSCMIGLKDISGMINILQKKVLEDKILFHHWIICF